MTKKIIVVGAGIAGLTAAYTLQKDGFDVEVLERNDAVLRNASSSAATTPASAQFGRRKTSASRASSAFRSSSTASAARGVLDFYAIEKAAPLDDASAYD